ncbi:hypothetical protein F0L68_03075 [Solihabitans fulvus]|uniref:Uncharacterized protein n=1 Tax=Solihabitans fulvus TaxID=1892852 RepID=A0A5B2XSN2_9PSEU|nr:hypothetical protein [Solihabitans fulvus]KAA2266115.1 hypothetical protein F0L68_03075 [Solihabitans fulvus]
MPVNQHGHPLCSCVPPELCDRWWHTWRQFVYWAVGFLLVIAGFYLMVPGGAHFFEQPSGVTSCVDRPEGRQCW